MYASLDLHKVYSQAVVMEKDGAVDREDRAENGRENMGRFSESLPQGTEIVTESSSTWY
ncbi:MAG: hypothetical protein JRN59_06390 [Nitrososphaerota archaeon]|nr:hypothetical protein [Nitrososphaerota archaeon]